MDLAWCSAGLAKRGKGLWGVGDDRGDEAGLRCGVGWTRDHAELRLSGELDVFAVPRLRQVMRGMVDSGLEWWTIDLSGLTFADRRGTEALMDVVGEALSQGVIIDLSDKSQVIGRPNLPEAVRPGSGTTGFA